MANTKALFSQRFDAARTAWTHGDEPAAAESLRWAIAAARSDRALRPELASALFNLGKLSRRLGQAGEAEAEPLLTESLALGEELFGRQGAAIAPVLHELSRLYLQQSQHARAEEALGRLLAIARVKGEEHPDVATALVDLAFVKRKLGDDASAEALYRDALRIRERVLEPNNMLTVGTLERLSETCAARGNFAEAVALLRRALPAREAALGAGHERVRAARSRLVELESHMAVPADKAPAAAATPPRDVVDTPTSQAPSPTNSKDLELLGRPELRVLRPAPRPRERSKTPTIVAAVAVTSLMASSIPTPSASQIVIPSPKSARPSGGVTGRESQAAYRDVVLADVAHGDATSGDAPVGDWRSPVTQVQADSPEPARKKRTVQYVSAGVAAVVIAMAGLLMLRPRVGNGRIAASAETSAAQRTAAVAAAAPVVTGAATGGLSIGTGMAAKVAVTHADSLRAASATPVPAAPVVQREQRAPELRAPRVDVRLDSVNMPSMPAAPSVDAILRSAERQRASDTNRTETDEVPRPTSTDVDHAHTAPKIIGRPPEPAFPEPLLRSGRREGQVVVRFLVNELGRVDVTSIIVERSDDEQFTDAVRDVLPRFRFEPAHTLTVESKPVATWVSVPFRFTTKKK